MKATIKKEKEKSSVFWALCPGNTSWESSFSQESDDGRRIDRIYQDHVDPGRGKIWEASVSPPEINQDFLNDMEGRLEKEFGSSDREIIWSIMDQMKGSMGNRPWSLNVDMDSPTVGEFEDNARRCQDDCHHVAIEVHAGIRGSYIVGMYEYDLFTKSFNPIAIENWASYEDAVRGVERLLIESGRFDGRYRVQLSKEEEDDDDDCVYSFSC